MTPLKLLVWFLAVFLGAVGWLVVSAVAANVYGLPRASYSEALAMQVAVQIILHMTAVALGLAAKED